jgi:two-component system chemotaxis response regulator CheB
MSVKVLVVDDSAVVRRMLSDALGREPGVQVVGTAPDPFVARDLLLKHDPDVLTLDIEMPRMDGLTFLARLMEHRPMPVIVVSSITQQGSAACVEALRLGAVDVIAKPEGPGAIGHVAGEIARRVRELGPDAGVRFRRPAAAPAAPTRPPRPPAGGGRPRGLMLIGASTGGTQAIEAVLSRMPAEVPPILIVQHMPPVFTRAFAERLDKVCPMRVVEAAGGEPLEPGVAYVAPGDRHLVVTRHGVTLRTALTDAPAVHYQRPAVDVLFRSAAALQAVPIVAAVLTGMGADGADGLLALRHAGAVTFAEDERSCVVYGMPREAIARGAACHVATLLELPAMMMSALPS